MNDMSKNVSGESRNPTSSFLFAVTLLLAACGGGGSTSSGGASSSSGGSTGTTAMVTEKIVPGTENGDGSITDFKATNDGLYMVLSPAEGDFSIVKLSSQNIFHTATTPGGFFEYVPVDIYGESPDEISFYWFNVEDYGFYNQNNGGTSSKAENDMFLQNLAAGTREGTSNTPWAIGRGRDIPATSENVGKYFVYKDDGSYTGDNTASDRFSTAADLQPVLSGSALLLGDPERPYLYVASGNAVDIYAVDGLKASFTLNGDDFDSISQLTWYDGDLWIAFGKKILRYETDGIASGSTGVIKTYAQIGVDRLGADGNFCIDGNILYTADGKARVISAFDPSTREWNWISQGTLSAEQNIQAQVLGALVEGAGIYCADHGNGVLFSPTGVSPSAAISGASSNGETVLVINPLSESP